MLSTGKKRGEESPNFQDAVSELRKETLRIKGKKKTPLELQKPHKPATKRYLLCETLTSSVTLKTPDVTKLSWKPKCPTKQTE